MSMSEAHKELNIKEQVDNEAILREEMGDNPLITLFSGRFSVHGNSNSWENLSTQHTDYDMIINLIVMTK